MYFFIICFQPWELGWWRNKIENRLFEIDFDPEMCLVRKTQLGQNL